MAENETLRMISQARAAQANGDPDAAISFYQEALRLITPEDGEIELAMALRKATGAGGISEHPQIDALDSRIRYELVQLLRGARRFEEAVHHAEIALYLDQLLYGSAHNDTSASHLDLGLALLDLHRFDEALEHLDRSREIDKNLTEDVYQPHVLNRLMSQQLALNRLGFLEKAAKNALDVLPRIERSGLELELLTKAFNSTAQCLQDLGEHTQAQTLLEKAIRLQLEHNPRHADLGLFYENIAFVFHEKMLFDDARRYFELAVDAGRQPVAGPILERLKQREREIESWSEITPRGLYDVFISFSLVDENWSKAVAESLESWGLKVWMFTRSEGWNIPRESDEILASLETEIDRANLVLLICSGASLGSEWVFEELACAHARNKPTLAWYPEGVRVKAVAASTRPNVGRERLGSFSAKLVDNRVYSYFGFGLRQRNDAVIASAVIKKLIRIYPKHPLAKNPRASETSHDALDGTSMWPVFVDDEGQALFERAIK